MVRVCMLAEPATLSLLVYVASIVCMLVQSCVDPTSPRLMGIGLIALAALAYGIVAENSQMRIAIY